VGLLTTLYDLAGLVYEPMFMRRAAAALLLLSLASAGAGVLVVNRRMAFFPDAVGHSVFVGVALALWLRLDVQLTTLAVGVTIGLGVVGLARRSRLAPDTVIGLVFSGAVAAGLALVSRQPHAAAGLSRFFLGDALTVDDSQLAALLALDAVSFVFLAALGNRLTLACVLPDAGAKNGWAELAFGAYLALVVMVSVQAVGVLLVTALLVAPAAAGRLWASSAKGMFWTTLIVSVVSGQAGLWLSYLPSVNASAGAVVVLCNVAAFGLIVVWRRLRLARG
jgi:zinc transport system permease protein